VAGRGLKGQEDQYAKSVRHLIGKEVAGFAKFSVVGLSNNSVWKWTQLECDLRQRFAESEGPGQRDFRL
jgi:hypothetical protein